MAGIKERRRPTCLPSHCGPPVAGMAPFTSVVFAALYLASATLAAPSPVVIDKPISASFTKQINRGNLKGLLARDQARAKGLVRRASKSPFSESAVVRYG